MLRFTIALVFAMAVCGAAESADRALPRRGWHRAVVTLPAGLPRPHYNFRTTITYREPYARPVYVPQTPAVVVAPLYVDVPSYDYEAPYYGPYVPYGDRLPYACGVYGYC